MTLGRALGLFGWGSSTTDRIDWNVTGLIKALGVAIIVVGTIVTLWDVRALHDAHGFTFSQSSRYFLRFAIEYAFEGGLVIVLAGVADRLGGDRSEEELAESEPSSPPERSPATP